MRFSQNITNLGPRLAILVIGMVGLLPGWKLAAAEVPAPKEYQLKAAFIFNFLKFVEWPDGKFADASAPIVIGVVGTGPFKAVLDSAIKDRKINGRDLVVNVLETPGDSTRVHLLFLSPNQDPTIDAWLSAAKHAEVLTVGESEAFWQHGGIIRFVTEADKLRFEIDMDTADATRLKISAQLQKLAKAVRRKQ